MKSKASRKRPSKRTKSKKPYKILVVCDHGGFASSLVSMDLIRLLKGRRHRCSYTLKREHHLTNVKGLDRPISISQRGFPHPVDETARLGSDELLNSHLVIAATHSIAYYPPESIHGIYMAMIHKNILKK